MSKCFLSNQLTFQKIMGKGTNKPLCLNLIRLLKVSWAQRSPFIGTSFTRLPTLFTLSVYDLTVLCLFFFFFWPYCMACGILVPQPGIKPAPPALEAWHLNQWTAREVLSFVFAGTFQVSNLVRMKSSFPKTYIYTVLNDPLGHLIMVLISPS